MTYRKGNRGLLLLLSIVNFLNSEHFFHIFKFSVAYKPYCFPSTSLFHFVRWTRFEGSCIVFQCGLILHAYSYWKRNMNWPIKYGLGCLLWLHFLFCIVFGSSDSTVKWWYFQSLYDNFLLAHSVMYSKGTPESYMSCSSHPQTIASWTNRLTAQRSFRIQQKSRFS